MKKYQRATLTIVAAAGIDEDHGLLGVGDTPRLPQHKAQIENISVVSTVKHSHNANLKSVWWRRGWTLKESVLSRRGLVFVEHQTYFECHGMNCYGALEYDVEAFHAKDEFKSLTFMHSGILSDRYGDPNPFERRGSHRGITNWMLFRNLIQMYSRRMLTKEKDSLDAFIGICPFLSKIEGPVYHIYGVSFLLPQESSIDEVHA